MATAAAAATAAEVLNSDTFSALSMQTGLSSQRDSLSVLESDRPGDRSDSRNDHAGKTVNSERVERKPLPVFLLNDSLPEFQSPNFTVVEI